MSTHDPQNGSSPGERHLAPTDGATPTVLIAEDDADMREYLSYLLSAHWQVRAFADGQAALEAVRKDPPDLVLSDVTMPRLSGFELLSALRDDSGTRVIPVVLLTGRDDEESTLEGLGAGADDYLVKPFSAAELIARVRTHMELSHQRTELAREQVARAAAEEMSRWLENLHALTDAALDHLDLNDLLDVLLERIREIADADAAAIALVDDEDRWVRRAHAGHEVDAKGFAGSVAAAGRPLQLAAVDPLTTLMGVPLIARSPIGELYIGREDARPFTEADVQLIQIAAERLAMAIERATLFERERRILGNVQRSLLPQRLPELPGMDIGVRYCPGETGTNVGGDWYEVLALADGRVGLAIGDVAGRGPQAAALMSQLSAMLRVYAVEHESPTEVVGRLDQLMRSLGEAPFSTLLYALVDLRDSTVRIANAAHLPPLIVSPGGEAGFVEVSRSGPLGMVTAPRIQDETVLEPGSTIVLYTDGLVERRGHSLDEGLASLLRLGNDLGAAPDADQTCERITHGLLDSTATDDTAVLAARVLPVPEQLELTLPAEPGSLAVIRRELTRWLEAKGAGVEDVGSIMLASGEAAANVVEHAYGPHEGSIEFRVQPAGDDVVVQVRDHGRWRPQRDTDRGRGRSLMAGLMDTVEVETGDDGTLITLSKSLARGA